MPSLLKPWLRFSRTRLSDVLHTLACADFRPATVGTFKFFQERVYPDFTLYGVEVEPVYAGTASVGPNKPPSVTEDVFSADLVVERIKAVGRLLLGPWV